MIDQNHQNNQLPKELNFVFFELDILNQIPRDSVLCIFHTQVANQIPLENKKVLLSEIKAIGSDRDVFHLYNNMNDGDFHLDYFIKGNEYGKTIGKTDGHGRWFEWKME